LIAEVLPPEEINSLGEKGSIVRGRKKVKTNGEIQVERIGNVAKEVETGERQKESFGIGKRGFLNLPSGRKRDL